MRQAWAAACCVALACAAANASPPSVAGHYYLEGVHEVGSELLLREDGRFEWMLAYGAVDAQASGRWRRAGDVSVATPERPAGPRPGFGPQPALPDGADRHSV